MTDMTSVVLLWEEPNGERRWEAVTEAQYTGFLEQILSRGVHPATVMVAYAPILFHWVWKKFHKGLSDVYFQKINEEIYGTEPVEESKHKPVDVPVEKKNRKRSSDGLRRMGDTFGAIMAGTPALQGKLWVKFNT